MRFKIENRYVARAVDFLERVEAVAADSRARTRLVRLLRPISQQLEEDEKALFAEFFELDEAGAIVTDAQGNARLLGDHTVAEYNAAHAELAGEVAIVDAGTFDGHRERLISLLEDYDQPLSGEDATVYDVLLTALEDGED